jgi:hypothetical protein
LVSETIADRHSRHAEYCTCQETRQPAQHKNGGHIAHACANADASNGPDATTHGVSLKRLGHLLRIFGKTQTARVELQRLVFRGVVVVVTGVADGLAPRRLVENALVHKR